MISNILVSGGAGFIGSHFVRAARAKGLRVIVVDDLSTGFEHSIPRDVLLVRGDVADRETLRAALRAHRIDAVAHFASKIDIGASVANPRFYFESNVVKSLALLDIVIEENIGTFLFSSSASVYGPSDLPLAEDAPLAPVNPYGMTKLAVEHALAAYGRAYGLRWAALRYFNAAGAHPDGTLRESHDPETHLIPLAIDAALGKRGPLTIFGGDYTTPDGTCVRDYVHVCDLAEAHLAALEALRAGVDVGATNLGTGRGFSVKEVIDTCARVLGKPVPHKVGARRAGDPAVLIAQAERAKRILAWAPQRGELATVVEDAVRSRTS